MNIMGNQSYFTDVLLKVDMKIERVWLFCLRAYITEISQDLKKTDCAVFS